MLFDLTERDFDEIKHCVDYATKRSHGSDGHLRMRLVAKMARALAALSNDAKLKDAAGDVPILPEFKKPS